MSGSNLLRSGEAGAALIYFQKAIEMSEPNVTLYLFCGAALHDLGRYDEAVACYLDAIELNPELGEAYNNLGNSQMALGLFNEASESFLQSSRFLGTSPVPVTARATALQALGRVAEAEEECRRALALAPDFAEAHWNLALNLLLNGRYSEGWSEYEWRWRKPDFTSPCRHTEVPLWDGSQLHGRTILLHAEQGFGDAIQFVRYVPLVLQRGGRVVIECHPPLVKLFQGMKEVATVVAFGEELPKFSCQAPFLSLPRILNTTLENIPIMPCLSIPVERLAKWQKLIIGFDGIKIGIVWAGSSIHRNDRFRSLPLSFLASFVKRSGISLFSLQIGDAQRQLKLSPFVGGVTDLTSQIIDFSDTAALIEQLDLVISVDTAVAHLAGTLGKPVFLLIPFAPDWRWLLERSDSPWYPSMHIFRQNFSGRWEDVVDRVHGALNEFVCENKKSFGKVPKD